ncbi:helix-turn-helix transcriptional regulator [Catenovulum sp. SM1970]|uniref:helix-turn-helix domain-containing protein n=1 Tax=Marinifaba aquimaris TaxID=2741323 RepID=UPI001574ABEE|nr:helix-turn-helix transcriptional regulator [Marinifaba aquimaris]NTS78075.1 helix-turn-helix transcriptional regulator [Marinifaba aquimaris]
MNQLEQIAKKIKGKQIISYDLDYFIDSAYNLEDCVDFLPKFDQPYAGSPEQKYEHVFDRSLKLVPGAAIFACHEELPNMVTEKKTKSKVFVLTYHTNLNSYNLSHKNQNLRNKLSFSGICSEQPEILSTEAGIQKNVVLVMNEEGLNNLAKLTNFPEQKVQHLLKMLDRHKYFFHQYSIPLTFKTRFDELIKLIKPNTTPNLLVLSANFFSLISEAFDLLSNSDIDKEQASAIRSANLAMSAKTFIDDYANMVKNAQQLAEMLNTSVSTLQRQFKAAYNTSIGQYIKEARLETASDLLKQDMSIDEVSQLLGYSYRSAFERAYKNYFGVSPGKVSSNSL